MFAELNMDPALGEAGLAPWRALRSRWRWAPGVVVLALAAASHGALERWPLVVAMVAGATLLRWRRSIGRAIASF